MDGLRNPVVFAAKTFCSIFEEHLMGLAKFVEKEKNEEAWNAVIYTLSDKAM
jgi:hypothetical protein